MINFYVLYSILSANTINVINKGSKSIRVGFFKNIGPYQPSFKAERTINVAPGSSLAVQLSRAWEGRVQKLTGLPSDPATWAEINFDAKFMGMTFCDISLIRGYNGAMEFSSQDGLLKTGFKNNIYPSAPNQFKRKDSGGYDVLEPTQPFTGGTNQDLVNYYRTVVSKGNSYILPDDHASSHGTKNKRINLIIY